MYIAYCGKCRFETTDDQVGALCPNGCGARLFAREVADGLRFETPDGKPIEVKPSMIHDVRKDSSLLDLVQRVFLDGKEIHHAFAYDAENGWVERYVTDPNGDRKLIGDSVATERLHGKVEVQYRPVTLAQAIATDGKRHLIGQASGTLLIVAEEIEPGRFSAVVTLDGYRMCGKLLDESEVRAVVARLAGMVHQHPSRVAFPAVPAFRTITNASAWEAMFREDGK